MEHSTGSASRPSRPSGAISTTWLSSFSSSMLARPLARPVYPDGMLPRGRRAGVAALGHYFSQQQLFAYEKPDTRQPVMKAGTKIVLQWGNPYTNFVGDVNGIDTVPTGYGVYWPIILEVARSHGAPGSVGRAGY